MRITLLQDCGKEVTMQCREGRQTEGGKQIEEVSHILKKSQRERYYSPPQ
jgi:hypothetical protein